jgi:uncharacterized protein (DUF488 family)
LRTIYTIGHSSHSAERFVDLLQRHGIEVVVDVRSIPYSRFVPQSGREKLRDSLQTAGIKYVWLGNALGGRRQPEQEAFQRALERVRWGAEQLRVALMCAEEDPLRCHRRRLLTPELLALGDEVLHIRGDGRVETDEEVEVRSAPREVAKQGRLFPKV